MDKLERIRKAQLAQVKYELTAAETLTHRKASIGEAADRLERLKELAGKFGRTQESIDQDQEDEVTGHNFREEFDLAYYAARDLLEKYILDNNPNGAGSSKNGSTIVDENSDLREAIHMLLSTQRTLLENLRMPHTGGDPVGNRESIDVRLPAINVPTFNGDRRNWNSFKNIFLATIHNRTDLKNSLKLQYLSSFLEGRAKQMVSSFEISDANYPEAWAALTKYYDKKKYSVFAFIQEFLDQPAVKSATFDGLRKLVTTSDEVVRQLQALGDEYNTRDPWLIQLLLEKLDEETQSLWAKEIVGMENPSFDDFLTFLDNRCDALESCVAFRKRTKTETPVKSTLDEKVQSLHSTMNTGRCAKCAGEHSIYRCDEFKMLDLQGKRELVMRAKLCFNCLRPSHAAQSCKSKYLCRGCNQRHHTMLCRENETAKQAFDEEPHNAFILPTAIVRVKGINGKLLQVRALIDSGSEASLISETCAKRLGLPRSHENLDVTGVGHQSAGTTRGAVKLEIFNRFDDTSVVQTTAFVMEQLASTVPTHPCKLHPRLLEKKVLKRLADPAYHQPGPIDLILGSDLFLVLLQSGQVKDNDNITVAQETIFGWIVSGNRFKYTQSLRASGSDLSTGHQ